MIFNFCPNCGKENSSKKQDFKCSNCNKEYYQNSKPTGAVIPIYKGKELLMSVRRNDPGKGNYDFVGGFLNNGEDPIGGAIREFEEETGYKLKKEELDYLGIYVDEYLYQGDNLCTFNVTYIAHFDEKPSLTPSDDVADLVWMDIDAAEVLHAFKYQVKVFKDIKNKLKD
jgi:8-oxo-dGTP pyrophosphatase MutT (NUDIX family)